MSAYYEDLKQLARELQGQFAKVKFTVLEEQMFGVPIYKQDWFRQRRAARSNRAS